jgi:hypothetical protein
MPPFLSRRRLAKARKRVGKWARAAREVLLLAPRRPRAMVIVGTFVSSVLDLVGITMIVPLIVVAANLKESTKGSVVAIRAALESVGLPFAAWP